MAIRNAQHVGISLIDYIDELSSCFLFCIEFISCYGCKRAFKILLYGSTIKEIPCTIHLVLSHKTLWCRLISERSNTGTQVYPKLRFVYRWSSSVKECMCTPSAKFVA